MTDTLEQLAQRCYRMFGTPSATTFCTSACRDTIVTPFTNTIVPVWYCPQHTHLWKNPDGAAHNPDVLRLSKKHFNVNIDEGPAPCQANCHAISLSHELCKRGLWHPPDVSVHWCPDHGYLHVCRGDETPCGSCVACNAGTWCVFCCRGELASKTAPLIAPKSNTNAPYDPAQSGNADPKRGPDRLSRGEPVCPWSGRVLSNVDAPHTKLQNDKKSPPKSAIAKTAPAAVGHFAVKTAGADQAKKSGNVNRQYINAWLSLARDIARDNKSVIQTEHRDIDELVGSWALVSANWPTELHIAGWVFLLSAQNTAPFAVHVAADRRGFIDAMAQTQYKKLRASNAADAIVCHMLQHPIPPAIIEQLQKNNSLFQ